MSICILIAALCTACSFSGEEATITNFDDPGVTPIELLAGSNAPPALELRSIILEVANGMHLGAYRYDVYCVQSNDLTWNDYLAGGMDKKLKDSTFNQFEKAGLRLLNDPNALFEREDEVANLRLAGFVKNIKMNLCVDPYQVPVNGIEGEAYFQALWQVFDIRREAVVYQVVTECGHRAQEPGKDAAQKIMKQTFEICVRHLIADQDFRGLLANDS